MNQGGIIAFLKKNEDILLTFFIFTSFLFLIWQNYQLKNKRQANLQIIQNYEDQKYLSIEESSQRKIIFVLSVVIGSLIIIIGIIIFSYINSSQTFLKRIINLENQFIQEHQKNTDLCLKNEKLNNDNVELQKYQNKIQQKLVTIKVKKEKGEIFIKDLQKRNNKLTEIIDNKLNENKKADIYYKKNIKSKKRFNKKNNNSNFINKLSESSSDLENLSNQDRDDNEINNNSSKDKNSEKVTDIKNEEKKEEEEKKDDENNGTGANENK